MVDCEVAFDNLTRQLYATDASHYQIAPAAVAFPRSAAQAGAVICAAAEGGVSLIPRGAGTGLVGGAIGDGLIIDFARHQRAITEFNPEQRSVRVGAGVVLDQLNAFLKPHGLCFGPDVATSSRATLGGMIANNSSGAWVPVYGTTGDHVRALELILADGRIVHTRRDRATLASQRELIARLVREHAAEIDRRLPPGLQKRWPGYGLDRVLRAPEGGDPLALILSGSEGTLAGIISAELSLVPVPQKRGLGLLFFASVAEAMQATVELLDLQPAAIEHIDRILLDQTKDQRPFQTARDLLELDTRPCEAILLVEFFEDVPGRLASLEKRKMGLRKKILTAPDQQNLIWSLRKAGLSLLTGRPGSPKPVTCIEDAAVRPRDLPAYHAGLERILGGCGLEVCYYGHAATGLLHVRPVLDLRRPDDLRKFREVSDEVSALVREFKGSLCAEHGVGLARTEYLRTHLGDELLDVLRQIKTAFDPANRFNPGKILGDGRYRIDANLRQDAAHELTLPFTPRLAFAAKDHSFLGNLEQCNGCGGCLKQMPTMCPTFAATGDEMMSTRGRANLIRAVLAGHGESGASPLLAVELDAALSNCLSCKACTTECPSNVNLALLKAELRHARHERHGLPLSARVFSAVDLLGALGCVAPGVANAALNSRPVRWLAERLLRVDASRPFPRYARERFDTWFGRRASRRTGSANLAQSRGRVILWDDTFVRYHEPPIGQAAVAVLEAAGFEVVLPRGRQCCGRPSFSQGDLNRAARLGRHNLELLAEFEPAAPIIFLEPSCWSMFAEDYRELKLGGADEIGRRCFLFEQFIEALLSREPDALTFRPTPESIAIHAHCHAKALLNPAFLLRLAQRLPGRTAALLDTGCCGMAGAFGMMQAKQALSRSVAGPLVARIGQQPSSAVVVASGTSCRHQIAHLNAVQPRHMAEVLAAALVAPGGFPESV